MSEQADTRHHVHSMLMRESLIDKDVMAMAFHVIDTDQDVSCIAIFARNETRKSS